MNVRFCSFLFLSTLLLAGCVTNPTNPPTASPAGSNAAQTTAQSTPTASIGESATVSANFLTYDGGTYQIQYPQGWTVREDQNVVLFQSPASDVDDAFQENVNVIVMPTDQTIEAFVEAALTPSMESESFKLIDSNEATLSGKPARKFIYSEQSADAKLQYLQVFSVNDGLAAIVTYTATASTFDEIREIAEAMIASFQLKADAVASAQANPVESSMEPQIVRKWRIYSESIYFDSGGHNFLDTPVTTVLQLNADQTWSFSSSSGTWSVQAITDADWQKWGVPSYGPTRKLVLNGWNSETNDGPIEETDSRVDFMWVIYRVGPPTVSSPAQIQMKFGQTYS